MSDGRALKALIVDWGGVMTTALHDTMSAWAEGDGIDLDAFGDVMREWVVAGYEDPEANPVHALERGEISVSAFEQDLATRLRVRSGHEVRAEGLIARMFAGFAHANDMSAVVRRARTSGLKTGLLSNSWGNDYPREGWDDLFDVVVISGEVGMRKPDRQIYEHAAALLQLMPAECVFVDDLPPNVRGAVAVGMVGVHHTDVRTTVAELEVLFGIPLGG